MNEITLTDIAGKEIYRLYSLPAGVKHSLESNLSPGTYVLKVVSGDKVSMIKLLHE